MSLSQPTDSKRKRAPSKRALATRERVLDAAEAVFAQRGFDGATIRDIAAEAGEPVGTIHHHGGGKEALFQQTVARRAEALSRARLEALARAKAGAKASAKGRAKAGAKAEGAPELEAVLEAFIRPFFDLSKQEARWRNYARLVAFVSVDDRWSEISAQYFDPTAEVFLAEICALVSEGARGQVAASFVFTVSSTLALLTSQGRIAALSGALGAEPTEEEAQIGQLVRFCAAGMRG